MLVCTERERNSERRGRKIRKKVMMQVVYEEAVGDGGTTDIGRGRGRERMGSDRIGQNWTRDRIG